MHARLFDPKIWILSTKQGPRLKELYLDLFFISSSDGGLDMGMENLPWLQDVFIEF
jgi:hypothetical protein